MKILMVNKFLYPNGGSETYIFKIGEQLVKMGNEVQYFGMEHPDRVVGNHAESYTASMDFHTGRLKKLLYPFKIIYSAEARRKIEKVLKDFNPDVVHLNNFNFQLTPSIIYEVKRFSKRTGKRIKLLFTAHDYQWICPNHMMQIPASGELCSRCVGGDFRNCAKYKCIHNSRVKSWLGTLEAVLYQKLRTYRLVDTIICPSEFMKQMLSLNPVLKDKTITMHNFIDREETVEDIVYGKSGDYILYFGRYSAEKGIKTLANVCRNLPDIPFIFAGGGLLEKELAKIANVRLMGFLRGKELREVIVGARFVVFPSEWYENCPFSVMEAQMYGTPVLGANIGGTSELIREGETGELFESGNEEELQNRILQLWNDEALCAAYSQNCKTLFFDNLQEYCKKLLKLYSS